MSSCYNLKVIALSIRFAHENENNWPNIPSFLSSITSTRISTIVLTFNAYTCDHLFTREQAPLPAALAQLLERVRVGLASCEDADFVFNCQMGRGRTTTGMVTACLISTTTQWVHDLESDMLEARADEFFNWRHLNDAIISVHKRCPMAALDVAFCYVLNVGSPPEVREDLLARLAPVHEAGMRVNIATHVRNEKRPPILFW